MTTPATTDTARRQRIRRTAWILGACAVTGYALFLFMAMSK